MINPNTLNDEIETADTSAEGVKLEIAPSPELNELLVKFGVLQKAIMNDAPVEIDLIKAIKGSLDQIDLNLNGKKFTKSELLEMPNLKRTIEVWKEIIEEGCIDHADEMICINDTVLELLLEKIVKTYSEHFSLKGVLWITTNQAIMISSFRGNEIRLDSLSTINANQVSALGKFTGSTISLNGLEKISDKAALAFAEFNRKILFLNGLTSISDAQAAAFGNSLLGHLRLDGLTTLSDNQAKGISRYTGESISLKNISGLSKEALRSLFPIQYKMHNNLVLQQQINEARKLDYNDK